MNKIFISFFIFILICILIFIIFRHQFNVDAIINNIEKKTGIEIILNNETKWIFYPSISFKNSDVNIIQKENLLKIKNANININKNYWPTSPFHINLKSFAANYQGMEIRDLLVKAKYSNNIFNIDNFSGKIVEGYLKLSGRFDFDDVQPFYVEGKFNNISLNTLLLQSQVAVWDRVNIKLSSPKFKIKGEANGKKLLPISLQGTLPITGSFYFTSTEEERFGAALLSLLTEKIPNLLTLSNSVDFLLSKYADVPSFLKGTLIINNGLIQSDEILISNKDAKSTIRGSYNFLNDTIDGTVFFYDKEEIYLEASLKGKIENPQILVGGKAFTDNEGQAFRDIKQLLEDGINSFVDNLLKTND